MAVLAPFDGVSPFAGENVTLIRVLKDEGGGGRRGDGIEKIQFQQMWKEDQASNILLLKFLMSTH